MTDLDWPPVGLAFLLRLPTPVKILLHAIDAAIGNPPCWVRYTSAVWLRQPPTEERRQRWSRWTRQLERDGLLERQTELYRDRVAHVRVTDLGREQARCTAAGPHVDRRRIAAENCTAVPAEDELAAECEATRRRIESRSTRQ